MMIVMPFAVPNVAANSSNQRSSGGATSRTATATHDSAVVAAPVTPTRARSPHSSITTRPTTCIGPISATVISRASVGTPLDLR